MALVEVLDQEGASPPKSVRFFRGQMQTIISRALTDLEIKPVPSRRCFTLIRKLFFFPFLHSHTYYESDDTRYPIIAVECC